MSTINVDGLANAIVQELQNYSQEVTNEIKNNVDVVAKEVNEEIKKHISFKQHSGDYVKAFRIKNAYEDGYKKVNVWYVGNGQYRLTHLLEKGHALHQGGRARAFPHIKYGEEIAKKRMEELAKEAIENAGR
jgi:hypothetical protein